MAIQRFFKFFADVQLNATPAALRFPAIYFLIVFPEWLLILTPYPWIFPFTTVKHLQNPHTHRQTVNYKFVYWTFAFVRENVGP